MMRSSRVADAQSLTALDSADPRAGDCVAGTLIAAIAAASESTAIAFCDFVFWRMVTIRPSSVSVTPPR